ncbi:sensor histidine kinase [Paracidobacterium acidisoli]|uniref:histidine kinase n=1 Tax=Paracidobacterium acidisoli TaxID=2303751 RepID=A0A372ILJ0_9BACT|nr:ATP-binding protein [Paracidobacterium acidisoli]MBT9332812.1 HAMP domain-containing histidine kinase [Paracidobacterium acidisoli]
MFSRISRSFYRTAAWRLALGSTLVFAAGCALIFWAMYVLVAGTVRERSDSWLVGESETLKQVALTTPRDALYDRIVEEVAELATQEMAYDSRGNRTSGSTVFFAEYDASDNLLVWVGPKDNQQFLAAIQKMNPRNAAPASLEIHGWRSPFRVVMVPMSGGDGHVWLGLQDANAAEMLNRLLIRFILGWVFMVGLGFLITLLGLRRMLKRVDAITGTAASIRTHDLSTRVPVGMQQDEIARLARTFNNMLERISASVNQLRTLTDSVAHDLKSPITSVRGSLEIALSLEDEEFSRDLVAKAIESLDHLSGVITTSLDLAEAEGGALHLHVEKVDLAELAGRVAELYAPAFAEKRQKLRIEVDRPLPAAVDVQLFTRLLTNLMENELRYAGEGAHVTFSVTSTDGMARVRVTDDGPGFAADLLPRIFQRFAKGSRSEGHGLGLAFVNAVAGAHGGRALAQNRSADAAEHGACITIEMPLTPGAAAADGIVFSSEESENPASSGGNVRELSV